MRPITGIARGPTAPESTIGILDATFGRVEELLGTELPADTQGTPFVLERLSQMTGTHGTACAEIIHDIAPGATLVLAGFEDDVTWGAAVDELINSGVDIISHSIGFDNVYVPDGNHFFARKVDEAVSRGVLFVTAGGNEADKYFQGPWRDENGNGYLDVPGGEVASDLRGRGRRHRHAPLGRSLRTELPRLRPLRGDRRVSQQSRAFVHEPQHHRQQRRSPERKPGPGGDRELRATPVSRTSSCTHDANSPLQPGQRFWVWSSAGIDPSQGTGIGTLTLPADARGALSVAAVGWDTRTLEGFSSRGPTADGRVKPDVAGPDNVSTVTLNPFPGTSAATPHVSGAAALILSANPGMSVADLRRALEEAADLMGYPGRNNDIGAGLIDLHRAR